jgi:predicted ATPase
MPHFIAMLAEVLILHGDHARALDEIEHILVANDTTRDLYFNAELHRLAAECHLRFGEHDAAEAALQRAIATARAQGAKTFGLRAATALGLLWTNRYGEKAKAHALLRSALDALGDPEQTVDVRRARAYLTDWN